MKSLLYMRNDKPKKFLLTYTFLFRSHRSQGTENNLVKNYFELSLPFQILNS